MFGSIGKIVGSVTKPIAKLAGGILGDVQSGVMGDPTAGAAADQAAAAQLAFAREKYTDWKATYGDLEKNLASFYTSVKPDYYAAIGLEEFNKYQQTTMEQLRTTLAQRGIDPSSGIQASMEQQAELQAAEHRAAIRREAPRTAQEEQLRFLQIGLGQDPSGSVMQVLSDRATQTAADAREERAARGDFMGSLIGGGATLLGGLF